MTGPPLADAACAPLVAQLIVNQLPVTLTGSLKPITTFASSATPVAPAAGVVVGDGRRLVGGRVRIGRAGREVGRRCRSCPVAPPPLRRSDVVLLGAGAGPAPSKQFAVVP